MSPIACKGIWVRPSILGSRLYAYAASQAHATFANVFLRHRGSPKQRVRPPCPMHLRFATLFGTVPMDAACSRTCIHRKVMQGRCRKKNRAVDLRNALRCGFLTPKRRAIACQKPVFFCMRSRRCTHNLCQKRSRQIATFRPLPPPDTTLALASCPPWKLFYAKENCVRKALCRLACCLCLHYLRAVVYPLTIFR